MPFAFYPLHLGAQEHPARHGRQKLNFEFNDSHAQGCYNGSTGAIRKSIYKKLPL